MGKLAFVLSLSFLRKDHDVQNMTSRIGLIAKSRGKRVFLRPRMMGHCQSLATTFT